MSLYGFQHVQFNQGQLQGMIEKESWSFQPQYEYEIALPTLKEYTLLLKTKVVWAKKIHWVYRFQIASSPVSPILVQCVASC